MTQSTIIKEIDECNLNVLQYPRVISAIQKAREEIEKDINKLRNTLCTCYPENKNKADEECISCSSIRLIKQNIKRHL